MVTSLSYLILALAAASLVVTIFLAIRLKTVLYLLQQPVVKKMSPQLRLKPVKLDEVLGRGGREGRPEGRPEGRGEGRPEGRDGRRDDRGPRREGDRGPRPERREGDRGPRPERAEGDRGPRGEGRREDRGPRGERPEGDRGPRRDDRGPRPERAEGDRGPRPERTEGDRPRREDRPERAEGDRGPRRDDRGPRPERTEGDRAPRREFSETRDFAPAPQADFQAPAQESAPLAPRRPLFADNAETRNESAPLRENPVADASFVGSNSDDLQHGRRTTLKKKPRFDITEEDLKTEA